MRFRLHTWMPKPSMRFHLRTLLFLFVLVSVSAPWWGDLAERIQSRRTASDNKTTRVITLDVGHVPQGARGTEIIELSNRCDRCTPLRLDTTSCGQIYLGFSHQRMQLKPGTSRQVTIFWSIHRDDLIGPFHRRVFVQNRVTDETLVEFCVRGHVDASLPAKAASITARSVTAVLLD